MVVGTLVYNVILLLCVFTRISFGLQVKVKSPGDWYRIHHTGEDIFGAGRGRPGLIFLAPAQALEGHSVNFDEGFGEMHGEIKEITRNQIGESIYHIEDRIGEMHKFTRDIFRTAYEKKDYEKNYVSNQEESDESETIPSPTAKQNEILVDEPLLAIANFYLMSNSDFSHYIHNEQIEVPEDQLKLVERDRAHKFFLEYMNYRENIDLHVDGAYISYDKLRKGIFETMLIAFDHNICVSRLISQINQTWNADLDKKRDLNGNDVRILIEQFLQELDCLGEIRRGGFMTERKSQLIDRRVDGENSFFDTGVFDASPKITCSTPRLLHPDGCVGGQFFPISPPFFNLKLRHGDPLDFAGGADALMFQTHRELGLRII